MLSSQFRNLWTKRGYRRLAALSASAVSRDSVRDDNTVLAVPYNRNGAQKPVKRCKSSNFAMACEYTASGLTLAFAASDLPHFTKNHYSVGDPQHRFGDDALLPYWMDALLRAISP